MSAGALKLFLTGEPGVGKTTLVRRVIERLEGVAIIGFVTEEVREGGRRIGFQGRTIGGVMFPLAGIGTPSDFRLGPYGVTFEGLEAVGLAALTPARDTALVVLDEVGKMESFSHPFRDAVERLLAGDTPLLATVAVKGVGFVKRVRRDRRIEVLEVDRANRDHLLREILARLARAGIGAPAGSSSQPRP